MTATETSTARFDPIELEILWQSLISTVNEQARALQRAAFSPIVREAGDLANAVFDRRGRMVAQAVTGTPGHINSLAIGAASMLEEFPVETLQPGDILITNDSKWLNNRVKSQVEKQNRENVLTNDEESLKMTGT